MSSFQWFCLSLRVIGVWVIVTGLEMAGTAFNVAHGHGTGGFDVWAYLNQAVLHLVIGVLLAAFAPSFARLVYRSTPSSKVSDVEPSSD